MLKTSANSNIRDSKNDNNTALIQGIKFDHISYFNNEMFFEIASKNGYKEIVKILIKYDADVNLRDKDGNTALIWGLY